MNKIRVVIADDMAKIRDYFSMILSSESDMEVIGTASSGAEAYRISMENKPDIVLMDVQMEAEMAGIDATQRLKQDLDGVKVIILTIHEEDEIIFKAYAAGAMDYIVKTSSIVDVITSIRNVYNNRLSLRPEYAEKIVGEFTRIKNEQKSMVYTLNIVSRLTNTEFEILKDVYAGKTYRQIAKQRSVEDVTIRSQVNRILKKFEKESMKEVLNLLKELRIFDIYSGN